MRSLQSVESKKDCVREDQCSFRHDGCEHAKPTPKTAPSSEQVCSFFSFDPSPPPAHFGPPSPKKIVMELFLFFGRRSLNFIFGRGAGTPKPQNRKTL